MAKERLTTIESRAYGACDSIRESGRAEIRIEWRPSRTWGRIAVIAWRNEKAAEASGGGYCKESQALANFFRFLPDRLDSQSNVWATGGAGPESTIRALAAAGWILRKTYSGKTEDGYSVERACNV